ncbi:hypothetical protein B0H13DRAFT_1909277 [Mycena leptocephala]|nr:hypothetical protein B0H13DRAFT_1909277 [Mycena leptocephala]
MPHSREAISKANDALDQLNFANRGLGGDPNITTARPVMRRVHREQLEDEVSVQQKMSKLSKTERAAVDKAAERAEIRRAKARERMAIWRAKIKALPVEEQVEYQHKAQQARAKWREGNRRYLAIASWGYRNRKYIEMHAAHGDRTRYDDYLLKSDLRKYRRIRSERAQQCQEAAKTEADPGELSDLPDSSDIPTSDSEFVFTDKKSLPDVRENHGCPAKKNIVIWGGEIEVKVRGGLLRTREPEDNIPRCCGVEINEGRDEGGTGRVCRIQGAATAVDARLVDVVLVNVVLVDVVLVDVVLVDALLVALLVDEGLLFSFGAARRRRRRIRVAAEERGGDGGAGRALSAALSAT